MVGDIRCSWRAEQPAHACYGSGMQQQQRSALLARLDERAACIA